MVSWHTTRRKVVIQLTRGEIDRSLLLINDFRFIACHHRASTINVTSYVKSYVSMRQGKFRMRDSRNVEWCRYRTVINPVGREK